jgi:hypothetical protein
MVVADASDAIRQNATATADRSEMNSLIVLEIKVVPAVFGENYFALIFVPSFNLQTHWKAPVTTPDRGFCSCKL